MTIIIPEPLFIHSDLTTLIQTADIVAYAISWGLRLRRMAAPARPELRPLVDLIYQLQFRRETDGGDRIFGLKPIEDLRPRPLS